MNTPAKYQLPEEVENDPYHPQNTSFEAGQRRIIRAIEHHTTKLQPKQVEIAKQAHIGKKIKDIALAVNQAPQTVSITLKKPKVRYLLNLLERLKYHRDGASDIHRRQMLWEMAVDNQHDDPRTAIAALQELNKMAGTYPNSNESNPNINITINADQLPRTVLDG
jgi:hypothetical protein